MSDAPPNTPTLRDIAKRTGLALSTVSDSLNEKPGVAAKTRERVRAAAEAMGWKPNPLVSAWMSHVSTGRPAETQQGLAYVVCEERGLQAHFDTPTYAAYWAGARRRAEALGYHPEIFDYAKLGGKRLGDVLHHRGIGPVVFAPLGTARELELPWERFASVGIAYSILAPALHHVASHHFYNMTLAMEKMTEAGYRRIGFALPEEIDLRSAGMFSGSYLHALQRMNLSRPPPPFLEPFRRFGRREFQAWREAQQLDAVIGIVFCDEWLRGTGVAWASLDLKPGESGVPGIQQFPERIGAAAVDLVTAHWQRQDTGIPDHPKTSLIQGVWVP